MNVAMLLEMTADAAGDRVAVGPKVDGLTYSDLLARSRRLAALLTSRGVERLGLVDLNSEAVPLCLFGAGLAGAAFAPVNYRLPDDQLHAILRRLAPALVVVGPDVERRAAAVDGIEVIRTDDLLTQLADGDDATDDAAFVDPEEIAVLLFTSGTTGEPKAAVLRHRHLTSYILGSVEFLGAGEDDAQLVSVPPYHIAGISAVLSSVFSGRRIVYLPGFDPAEWVRTAAAEDVTQAMVVPTMLVRILGHLTTTGRTLERLRHLSYGGGRMPVDVIRQAMEVLPNVAFVNAYGLTETSSTIAVLGPDEHREAAASDDPRVEARLGSVGRPLPSIEVEIRDPEGNVLPPGERGEIFVRGEQVSGEYVGKRVLTDDGWFPTNDAGYLDDDGYLFLDGRLDDVIVRGAENLSPGEIEDVLLAHPAVAEAAVVGVPHPEWGEAVAAVVVLADGDGTTEEELQGWVRERLRSTKTPELVEFRTELPYNETGKLLRRVLRTELTERRPLT
jgi:acyl-CoA synthetase (AMP-forming)/AMP-acid ligase II